MDGARIERPESLARSLLDPRGLRFLAATFAAGAAYDLLVAALILTTPAALLAALSIPPPPDPMHFRFAALLLLALPLFYLLVVRDPERYAGVAVAGIGARLLGAGFLAAHVASGAPAAYAGFAAVDLAFAILHAWGLRWSGVTGADRAARPGS